MSMSQIVMVSTDDGPIEVYVPRPAARATRSGDRNGGQLARPVIHTDWRQASTYV